MFLLLLGFLFVCFKKQIVVCYCRSNMSDGEFPFVIVLILSDAGCLHSLALDIVMENMSCKNKPCICTMVTHKTVGIRILFGHVYFCFA